MSVKNNCQVMNALKVRVLFCFVLFFILMVSELTKHLVLNKAFTCEKEFFWKGRRTYPNPWLLGQVEPKRGYSEGALQRCSLLLVLNPLSTTPWAQGQAWVAGWVGARPAPGRRISFWPSGLLRCCLFASTNRGKWGNPSPALTDAH